MDMDLVVSATYDVGIWDFGKGGREEEKVGDDISPSSRQSTSNPPSHQTSLSVCH
jgi:hypothetical protein